MGDLGSIPGSGRSPGEGNGTPLQYSCLENPMDGGAWWATVHGVAKSRTRLSDFTSLHFMLSKKLYLHHMCGSHTILLHKQDPTRPMSYKVRAHCWFGGKRNSMKCKNWKRGFITINIKIIQNNIKFPPSLTSLCNQNSLRECGQVINYWTAFCWLKCLFAH